MKAAVVGAGLSGRMLAWRLAKEGAEVTLIDQNSRDEIDAGRIAAAMIAPSTEAVTTEPIVKTIGERSLALWPEWLADLQASTDIEVPFQKAGTLVVAHTQDQSDWQRFLRRAEAVLGQTQVIDSEELAAIEPELATTFSKAAYFENEGVLHNPTLYTALENWFDHSSVNWLENYHCEQLADDGTITGFDQPFDKVFDCRGNGARAALKGLRSVRGEVVRVYAPEVSLSRPIRLMHPRYPLYIAPRPNHEYVIGATQIESEGDHPVTVRSGLELLSALYSLHQGFSEAQIISLDVGRRPAFTDNLPKIIWGEKCVQFNGLYRHGYLFSPALVEDVIIQLNGGKPQFPSVSLH